ncbi:MAG: phytoene/squalene synthase family protein [Spirochaetota bacterium]
MSAPDLVAARATFSRGSRTYSTASRFFPRAIRDAVTTLYAFVRKADDYVDSQPQDAAGFRNFRGCWMAAKSGVASGDPVVDNFAALARERAFEPNWTEAFLDAMEADLTVSCYDHIDDTLAYVYGSAEVIGLYMTRLLDLPPEAAEPARMLGRSMQFINFIRDFAEDRRLGRRYLPLDGVDEAISDETWARAHQAEFSVWLRGQIDRYRGWGEAGRCGFSLIPRRYRVAIATAQDMYDWTAKQIYAEPLRVFAGSIKPAKPRILMRALRNLLKGGAP